jgi:thrombospondin type 3 repeat protein
MPTGDQQRCNDGEANQSRSLARKLACMVALAWSCDGSDPPPTPVDPNDLDGDGIPNAADICPQRFDSAPEHDEDGDGLGDECDNCPTVFNPDQSDIGEGALQFPDGVGDACDPRVGRGGDKLVALFAFERDESAAFEGVGWTIASDQAIADSDARWTGVRTAQGDGIAAAIRVPVLVWMQPSGGAIDVVVDGDGGALSELCGLEQDTDGDGFDEVVARVAGRGETRMSLGMPLMGEITISARRLIDVMRVATLTCDITHQGQHLKLEMEGEDVGIGAYTMAAIAAHAEVTSLVVYTAPFNHGAP